MSLQQLIYTSAAVKHFTEVELSLLLLNARKINQSLGVGGMLLYHEGSFLQVLEGEEAAVQSLFARIGRDPRHVRILNLLCRPIEEREFKDWAMGFVALKSLAASLPGYSEFLRHRGDLATAGGLAAKLLRQFREGRFRNYVDR